jgi:hypothetical protein
LATGRAMAAISTHWNASMLSHFELACPVMAMSGMESARAVYNPVTKFVAPGPDVQMASAIRPEALQYPSAACTAPSSCRAM